MPEEGPTSQRDREGRTMTSFRALLRSSVSQLTLPFPSRIARFGEERSPAQLGEHKRRFKVILLTRFASVAHSLKTSAALLFLGALALLGLGATPAQAALSFPTSLGEITGSAPATPFSALRSESVAVNDSNGHIFVADSGAGLVYDFTDASDTTPDTWDGSTTPAGSFGGGAVAVAVDNASGHVYVSDSTDAVIDKFDASGALIATFGDSTPTANGQLAGAAAPAGSFSPAASGSFGIAVNQSTHDLYAVDAVNQVIDVFNSSGVYQSQINDPAAVTAGLYGCGGAYADGIAINPTSGHVFVSDSCSVQTFEFDGAGAFVGAISGSNTPAGSFDGGYTSLALENSSGHLFVNDTGNSVVDVFDSSEAYLGQVTGTPGGANSGVAIGQSTGNVYVADPSSGSIKIFAPGVVVPDATTSAATGINPVSPTLNGHLDPAGAGNTTDCHFDYVDDASFQSNGFTGAQTVPCAEGNVQSTATDVHADISGLSPETTYHFRLSVANANGTNNAAPQTLTTPSAVTLSTDPATNIAQTGATLNGTLNPGGVALTDCHFDYGPDTSYGTTVPCAQSLGSIGSGTADVPVSADISGLDPGSFNHFRLVASNTFGTSLGQDQTFPTQSAGFGINQFNFDVLDQDRQPYTQAGGHPYEVEVDTFFNLRSDSGGNVTPDGLVKDVNVSLPPGLVGDPTAAPQCPVSVLQSFAAHPGDQTSCPTSSQIGSITIHSSASFGQGLLGIPVYNLVPQAGLPAQFGFVYSGFVSIIDNSVRTGSDYGLDSGVGNITTFLPVKDTELTLWGVPADSSHTADRSCNGSPTGIGSGGGCTSSAPPLPLFTNPTSCSGPQTVTARADSWQNVGSFVNKSATLPAITGCDKLQFKPSLSLQPDTGSADSAAGVNVDLKLPPDGLQNKNGVSASNLKKAVVTLPPGLTVNPSAADGLDACTPAQIGLNDASDPTCPDASKVGTADVHTPLLPDHLQGSLYLATPHDNPFDTLLAGYLVAKGDGVLLKLAGRFDTDPTTGQITATFDQNPQQPFDDLKLNFFGGARAPLATPETCGTYTTNSQFTPWSTPDVPDATSSDSFQITSGPNGGPCPDLTDPSKFTPGFQAGTVSPQAGSYSPFALKITRPDGQQNLKQIHIDMAPGLVANLNGVPKCSQAQITPGVGGSTSCPAGSQIGTVTVGAGAGSGPFFLKNQPVYLTDGYDGAPYGIVIDTHAVAGPFDLGHVVIRSTLHVDQDDAQVHIDSENLPNILQGIPLRIRSVAVNIDRPNFILNPTNCNPMQITGSVTGGGANFSNPADDTVKPISTPFHVGGCGALGFSPHLSGTILNGTQGIHRSDHPNLQFNLGYTLGDANLAAVGVLLPQSFQIDQANLGNICSETQLATQECAGRNPVGTASATTPILGSTLSGPVYAVSGSGGLPKLAVILHGPPADPVKLLVRGITSTVGARILNTFPLVPDAPVSNFQLTLNGGPTGYLVNNTNVCGASSSKHKKKGRKAVAAKKRKKKSASAALTADAFFTAQDGDTRSQSVPISAQCPKAKKSRKAAHKRK
jgi:hypothetical protein